MYLEKIEIQGFKSFAHKTTLIFPKETIKNKGITAIVGPNGSGKSNVADAIRWVLGEQSTKTLRAKKSEDVIFSGSDKKTRLGLAEVSLYLNNESKRAPIDYSEIVITRKLYRSGESEYLLNKNKVRLQDLQMLLAKGNIGQRTYSVIGQGMVDYFLIAPPHERKEFFDEASGVKEYQIKRNQALNKLISTYENLTKADLLLQEIEPRLKSLTRQVKKLEKREALLQNLKSLQRAYFGSIKTKLENNIKAISIDLNDLEVNHNMLNRDLKTVENNLTALQQEKSRNELFETLKNKYSNFIEEKNLLLRKQAVIKANKEVEYKKAGKINIIWLEKKQDEIKREKEKLSPLLTSLSEHIKELKEKIKSLSSDKRKIEIEKKEIEEKLNSFQLSILPKEIIGEDLKNEIASASEAYKTLITDLDSIKNLEDLNILKDKAREIDKKLTSILSKFSGETKEDKEKLITLKNKLNSIISKKENLTSSYNGIMIEMNAKMERNNVLGESLQKILNEEKNILEEIKEAKSKPASNKELLTKLEKENSQIEEQINELNKKINDIGNELNEFNRKEEEKRGKLFALQKEYQKKQSEINYLSEKINSIKINLAKFETKKEDLEKEIMQEEINLSGGFDILENPEDLTGKINNFKKQLEIIGGIDPETQKEYSETQERFDFLSSQVNDLKQAISSIEKIIGELDASIKTKFEKAFDKINDEFQKYFKILFHGGKAKLIKIKEEEEKKETAPLKSENEISADNLIETDQGLHATTPVQEKKEENPLKKYKQKVIFGIDIQATPPGKKIKNINILSGGERALTAIALICAIISNNPAPFIVLDEVDAALDEANSFKLSNILDELSHQSQFIVITHNRATMHKAELLYGVTMGDDGVSKLLSVKLDEAEKKVKK